MKNTQKDTTLIIMNENTRWETESDSDLGQHTWEARPPGKQLYKLSENETQAGPPPRCTEHSNPNCNGQQSATTKRACSTMVATTLLSDWISICDQFLGAVCRALLMLAVNTACRINSTKRRLDNRQLGNARSCCDLLLSRSPRGHGYLSGT